ncbi:MAG: phosphomethylpyrimidine synthase ThiC [Methanolobus sp.]
MRIPAKLAHAVSFHDHIAGAVETHGKWCQCRLQHITISSGRASFFTQSTAGEGLIAFRIAAHIGDSMKYGLNDSDLMLATKEAFFWATGRRPEIAIDPDGPSQLCPDEGPCTMCGDYCAIKIMKNYLTLEITNAGVPILADVWHKTHH